MQLFVQGSELHALQLPAEGVTIGDLKAQLAVLENASVEDLVLYRGGKPLENEFILAHCVSDSATLDLDLRMLGGKVHGSLARAGKVKGQTPKVEKKEKRKKKTGRAKRRMQYNRRFVNVVASFGRKKGPNSNSPQ